MNPNIERLKLLFIGLFVVAAIGVGVWQFWWVMPAQKCEKEQKFSPDFLKRVSGANPVRVPRRGGNSVSRAA